MSLNFFDTFLMHSILYLKRKPNYPIWRCARPYDKQAQDWPGVSVEHLVI
jgi:hypothetical protein